VASSEAALPLRMQFTDQMAVGAKFEALSLKRCLRYGRALPRGRLREDGALRRPRAPSGCAKILRAARLGWVTLELLLEAPAQPE
jgi:hypothetical protein